MNRIITLTPTKTTWDALNRMSISALRQTIFERLTDIIECTGNDFVVELLKALSLKKKLRSLRPIKEYNDVASDSYQEDFAGNLMLVASGYKELEQQYLRNVSSEDVYGYAMNLVRLIGGKSICPEYNGHELKGYSILDANVMYCEEFTTIKHLSTFCLSKDRGSKRMLAMEPEFLSTSIFCLYRPMIPIPRMSCLPLILYNIGFHDSIYNVRVSEYTNV